MGMANFLKMVDLDLENKRVLIRSDFNVPVQDGKITNDERIERALPTIRLAHELGAQIILMSHFGRPQEGSYDPQFSLTCVRDALTKALDQDVLLVADPWQEDLPTDAPIILLENTRFWRGELENSAELGQRLAALADVFVMDAFATAHRAHASTVAVAQAAKVACAGPLLCEELDALSQALTTPKKPVAAIVGGAKVSTKIKLIDSLLDKVDCLIVGGGIANTFLLAQGCEVGSSLVEKDCVSYATEALKRAEELKVSMPLPTDVIVAPAMDQGDQASVRVVADIAADEAVFDLGPATQRSYSSLLGTMQTILWNGPVGLFEEPAFSHGTQAIAQAVATSPAYTLAGGGDTLAAIDQFGFRADMSYISTGGGAFLAWCEGEALPAVQALIDSANR
jgi:phosphoglycerate kinase